MPGRALLPGKRPLLPAPAAAAAGATVVAAAACRQRHCCCRSCYFAPGAFGAPGAAGRPGAAGAPGAAGMPGALGAPGAAGAPGAPGAPIGFGPPDASGAPHSLHSVSKYPFSAPHWGHVLVAACASAGLKHMIRSPRFGRPHDAAGRSSRAPAKAGGALAYLTFSPFFWAL